MYCNDEIIAINQDSACIAAKPYMIIESGDKIIHVLSRTLSNGDVAFAAFNFGETEESFKIYLDGNSKIRDVWAKRDLAEGKTISLTMPAHTVRIFGTSKI